MTTRDKLLLIILKNIPKESEQLTFDDFCNNLKSLELSEDTPQYKFLVENNLIAFQETKFLPIGNSDFKIKISDNLKYVHLTDVGQVLLWALQSDYLREKFQEIGD